MRVNLGMRDHFGGDSHLLNVLIVEWLFSALESMCHKHPGPHSVLCQMEGDDYPYSSHAGS